MKSRRTPQGYDGNLPTSKTLRSLLSAYVDSFSSHDREWREKLKEAWNELVGEAFAKMTSVKSYQGGILRVSVKSSHLLSLLHHKEKGKIEQALKTRFPKANLKSIALKLES